MLSDHLRARRAYADARQTWRATQTANPALRIGDADRERAVAELQRHFVEGRLTSDELGDRLNQALAARTSGQLAEPLADLPRLPSDENEVAATPQGRPWVKPFASPPGMVLLGLVGLMLVTWLTWLPSLRLGV